MPVSKSTPYTRCLRCGFKPTPKEVWIARGLCSRCGARKGKTFRLCLRCRKRAAGQMKRSRAKAKGTDVVLPALRVDEHVLRLQRERIARGLAPSRSKNPLLDKPLEPRLE